MRSARMRVRVSLGPPAPNGTMIVIGREGYTCAIALAAIPKVAATAIDARTIFCICTVGTLAGRRRIGCTCSMRALLKSNAGQDIGELQITLYPYRKFP